MAIQSPLHSRHETAEASIVAYGPVEAGVLLVETFGQLEIEYAALRKAAALFDLPQRAVVSITGNDRIAFLDSMLTQELKTLKPGDVCRSFWLNRKGRIDADLTLVHFEDKTLIDLDVHSAELLVSTLSAFVFAEDIEIKNVTTEVHRISMHGPDALTHVGSIAVGDLRDLILQLGKDCAINAALAGVATTIWRHDSAGEVGIEIIIPVGEAASVYNALAEVEGVRCAGWHAYNMARIEAGTPVFNLDFGRDSLPHETGVLTDRVSFTKGCYLGQEVVARLESQGQAKQRLVALRVEPTNGVEGAAETPQPITGTPVHPEGDAGGDVIGAVTSSTFSPMLGAEPIMFAMVKYSSGAEGKKLAIVAESVPLEATVQHSLRFWPTK